MPSAIELAIRQICDEKGLSYESVIETIESAIAAAYRKDFGDKYHNLEAEFDTETGLARIYDVKTVVEDISAEEFEAVKLREAEENAKREAMKALGEFAPAIEEPVDAAGPKFNPKTDIMVSEAKILRLSAKVGDVIRTELPQAMEFGRMAAMTAKQVITQKLREAEREIIFNEYKSIEGDVITGTVQRKEGRIILVDIGRTAGIMKPEDQMPTERYRSGDRLKMFVREVSLGTRGPQILLSRTSEGLVRKLFTFEIPEVAEGSVEIKAIAREPGARTKVAVVATQPGVDPIGACIGQRGTRIQTITGELSGEKIDIIEWKDDMKQYITSALSPAKVIDVQLNDEERTATVLVPSDQLSLAIGRGGQNVRLAARLTGWKVNIQEVKPEVAEVVADEAPAQEAAEQAQEEASSEKSEPAAE
ncbi:MAG: Transcription termination factor NusA [Candidatus Uhrbacteria bacterium GW2011_GWD2_52_7]|uniref:Transcription termination/antitermination protein NusA n=1 Tax=Candidatus Uhrbacteria bacterium GW2011_GWD2_52_7 TaxID=1618989 RepID=A0A0G1ZPQ1_9BACT|nr:MAG: Transcription termination factor NusA [Candidatus Uhrbacteria bacterium GW2011_GWD2_52_7]